MCKRDDVKPKGSELHEKEGKKKKNEHSLFLRAEIVTIFTVTGSYSSV